MIRTPKGKVCICSTPLSYYENLLAYEGYPYYERYTNIVSTLSQYKALLPLVSSLAEPVYDPDRDSIEWYATPYEEGDYPRALSELEGEERASYETLSSKLIDSLKKESSNLPPSLAKKIIERIQLSVRDEYVMCYSGQIFLVAWGMRPTKDEYNPNGIISAYTPKYYAVRFNLGRYATAPVGNDRLKILRSTVLNSSHAPEVHCLEGYRFVGWEPSLEGYKVLRDVTFVAQYELLSPLIEEDKNEACRCIFDLGEHGMSSMPLIFDVPQGTYLSSEDIPTVEAKSGYRFLGWDRDPFEESIEGERVFTARYERTPWYLGLWRSLTGAGLWGCLRLLLWFLFALLLVALLSFLLRQCDRPSWVGNDGADGIEHVIDDGYTPDDPSQVDEIGASEGDVVDSVGSSIVDGEAPSIIGEDGHLPSETIIAPIVGEDGSRPPIERQPGRPDVIANRLLVYFEDQNPDVDACVQAFKKLYPDDKYKVIGVDRLVKMFTIQIPEAERNTIRELLPGQLAEYRIFMVDETLYEGRVHPQQARSSADKGWHLDAVKAREAWQITKGDSSVCIAIVDDGVEVNHPMFASQKRIQTYNVFTQKPQIARGDHGTHVAGIALGDATQREPISGIAPACRLMAVQVGIKDMITTSSLINGIMYALNQGADVINVSIGVAFRDLGNLSVEEQRRLSRTMGKNEEKVWKKVYDVARQRNSILVFGAGNEHVLASLSPMLRSHFSVNVAATNPQRKLSDFSNFGEGSNISAPGVDIYSAVPGASYKFYQGTSMAAPIVTGAIALMRSLDPSLTVEKVLQILRETGVSTNYSESPLLQIAPALEKIRISTRGMSEEERQAILRRIDEHQKEIDKLRRRLNN